MLRVLPYPPPPPAPRPLSARQYALVALSLQILKDEASAKALDLDGAVVAPAEVDDLAALLATWETTLVRDCH